MGTLDWKFRYILLVLVLKPGSCVINGKMLLVRIIENNNKIDAYLSSG